MNLTKNRERTSNTKPGKGILTRKRVSRMTALALTFGLLLTGCGSSGGNTGDGGEGTRTPDALKPTSVVNLSENVTRLEIPDTQMSDSHRAALARSGVLLLQKTAELEEDRNRNLLISPFSVQMALGMTAAGSDDGSTTQKQMMEVLLPGESCAPSALNQEMASFSARMEKDPDVSWNVANSIWVNSNDSVRLGDTYISDATNYYDADLFSAPMDAATRQAANQWVSTETRERIPEILQQLLPETSLLLINALAFDGEWAEPYEEQSIRENEDFTNADGSTAKVTMLNSTEHGLIRLGEGTGFIRHYKGYQYSFVGILPPEGMSAQEYLSKLSAESKGFSEAYLSADHSQKLIVSMPEFKTEFSITLDDVLKALGMEDAYSEKAAFRKMLTEDSSSVQISTVIHKTMIDVDRAGTKAAAATVVEMTKSAMPPEPSEPVYITLNRPFVYAIVDDATGVPIFLGTQNSMN